MRSEIAVEREAAKRANAHAAELEGNLNRNQEHSSAAIAGLETRIEGLQKQLDTAILESRSVSLQLEEERNSSQHSALEQQKLRDQLAQKGEAAQKAEATRLRLEAVEAELEKERGSAATLIQLRSEIAVERAASKKSEARAAELEENLNRNREDGIAAIAGLETRIEGLQKQLDTAILEARSVSLQLEEQRESSRQSALELQKLRDQLAQKSEVAQKAEATRLRLEAVEAELEKERGSAATLIQLRSEIAVERAASKKSEAHAAELEENLNRNREDGIAAITGLETRVEGLQEKLDEALLEARSVSLRLEEERESSQRSALEQQKLRDQLAEKSEAAQRAEARSAELETCLEQSVRDASSKVTALESQISDLRGQLDQSIQSRQSVEQQDQNLSVALGSLESSALEVLRQLATRHNAPVGGEMNQRR
jgi:hypothetical protein